MRNPWCGLELLPVLALATFLWGMSHSHARLEFPTLSASSLISEALESARMEADQIDLEARADADFADAVGKAVSTTVQSMSFELRFDRLDAFELLAFVLAGFLSWFYPRRTRLLQMVAGVSLVAGEAWQFLMGAERTSAFGLLLVAAGALLIVTVGAQLARLSLRR